MAGIFLLKTEGSKQLCTDQELEEMRELVKDAKVTENYHFKEDN